MGGGRKSNSNSSACDSLRQQPGSSRSKSSVFGLDGEDEFAMELGAFSSQLAKSGLRIRNVASDGSCLFRAVSDQLYGNESEHLLMREVCVDYMRNNKNDFAPFLDDTWTYSSYVDNMAGEGVWGGNLELQALSKALRLVIRIHQVADPSYAIVNSFEKGEPPTTIHLSYHMGQHYASVRRASEDPDCTDPAGHLPYHSSVNVTEDCSSKGDNGSDLGLEGSIDGDEDCAYTESTTSGLGSGVVHESEETRLACRRADKIETVVANAVSLIRDLRLSSSSQRKTLSGSASVTDALGTLTAEIADVELSVKCAVAVHSSRGVVHSNSTLRSLDTEAADIKVIVADAVERARANDILEAEGDWKTDKRLQRRRRRVNHLLDLAALRASELYLKVEGLSDCSSQSVSTETASSSAQETTPDLASEDPVDKRPKRPSKKKAQAAKQKERKARRLREQERAASSRGKGRDPGPRALSDNVTI